MKICAQDAVDANRKMIEEMVRGITKTTARTTDIPPNGELIMCAG